MYTDEWNNERALLKALEERNMKAFMQLYKSYGEDLLIYAYAWLQDPQLSIRIVDHFFETLWAEANFEAVSPPIHKFLIQGIQKLCEQQLSNR
jgi:hypothetical protein